MTFGDFPAALVAHAIRTRSLAPLEALVRLSDDLGGSPRETWEFLVECDGIQSARAAVGA